MSHFLTNLPVSSGTGCLIGLLAVWWVGPTTSGGVGLVMAICVVGSLVFGRVLSGLLGKEKKTEAGNSGAVNSNLSIMGYPLDSGSHKM